VWSYAIINALPNWGTYWTKGIGYDPGACINHYNIKPKRSLLYDFQFISILLRQYPVILLPALFSFPSDSISSISTVLSNWLNLAICDPSMFTQYTFPLYSIDYGRNSSNMGAVPTTPLWSWYCVIISFPDWMMIKLLLAQANNAIPGFDFAPINVFHFSVSVSNSNISDMYPPAKYILVPTLHIWPFSSVYWGPS